MSGGSNEECQTYRRSKNKWVLRGSYSTHKYSENHSLLKKKLNVCVLNKYLHVHIGAVHHIQLQHNRQSGTGNYEMTDYWVSTKKHYCEVCKCWVSGHLQNITRHESSIRHISTLRNKMIESHRRKTRKKKQDKFEEEEMKRLNTITLDNPVPAENNSTMPYVNDLFSYRPLMQPTLDFEAEKKRIAKSINRTLSGYEEPEHVDLNYNPTRWIATIDQDDGSLVYYNNMTGVRTKTRPKDFDGVIPLTPAQLTANWTLKFDPFKGRRYYHNMDTGEIRWIDETIMMEIPSTLQPYSEQNEVVRSQNKVDSASYIHFNVKCQLKIPETQQIQVKIQQNIKTEGDEEPGINQEEKYEPPNNELKNISGPVIGQWEVVNPRESVFSHWVESTDIFLNPDRSHDLHETLVGNDYQEDPIVNQSTEDEEKQVSKPVYKRSAEVMYEKYKNNVQDLLDGEKGKERQPLAFNKRRVRKRS